MGGRTKKKRKALNTKPPASTASKKTESAKKHKAEIKGDESHGDGEDQGCVIKCAGSWASQQHHGAYGYKCYTATINDAEKRALYNVTDFGDDYIKAYLTKKRLEEALNGDLDIGSSAGDKRESGAVKRSKKRNRKKAHIANYFGQSGAPFRFNTHHIMPETSLIKGLADVDGLKLLQAAGYQLNDGYNTIFVPKSVDDADFLELPDHPGGHQTYNDDVKEIVGKIKQEISRKKSDHGITEANIGKLRDKLVKWSTREYGEIVKLGWTAKDQGLPSNRINRRFS